MRRALIVLLASVLAPGALRAQATLRFHGQILCSDDASATDATRWKVLVVPRADRGQATIPEPTGAFEFTLPSSAVDLRGNEAPGVYVFLASTPEVGVPTDTVVLKTLRVEGRRGGYFDRPRQYVTGPVEVAGLGCSAIRTPSPLMEAEREDLVKPWEEGGLVAFDAAADGESVLLSDAAAATGGVIGQALRSVGNLVVRAVCANCPTTAGNVEPGLGPAADSIVTMVERLPTDVGRRGRSMGPSLNGLTHSVGFAFAPGPSLGGTPVWNPAGMLLSERVDVGLQREPDGFTQGTAIVPVKQGLTVGAHYYDFDQSLEYCDFGPPSDCVARDRRASAIPLPAEADTSVAGYALGLVRNGSFSLRGDPMENHLTLSERVVGLSAGFILSPSIAIGVSGKWSERTVEAYGVRRTTTTRWVGDTPTVMPETHEFTRDTVATKGVDIDVSALWSVSNFRVGVNLMNLVGRAETAWDGSEATSRSLGVGVSHESGPLSVGFDSRFFSEGPVDWAAGANLNLWGGAALHWGYSAEYSGVSVGASYRTVSYTFVDSDVLGERHLIGTRVRF